MLQLTINQHLIVTFKIFEKTEQKSRQLTHTHTHTHTHTNTHSHTNGALLKTGNSPKIFASINHIND